MALLSNKAVTFSQPGYVPGASGSCNAGNEHQSQRLYLLTNNASASLYSLEGPKLESRKAVKHSVRRKGQNSTTSAAAPAVQSAQTSAAEKNDEAKALRPTPAELARTLTAVCGEGTLATVSPDGWPLASLVQFALDAEGRPVMRLDPGAMHTVNLEKDNRCSLHVQLELPGKQKPQCTLKGRVCTPSDDMSSLRLDTAWQRRFGKDMVIEEKSYPLCWLEVEEALSMQDFGEEESWVAGAAYSAAAADPLRECAARIVEDMNREHWEDVRRFCHAYAGMDEEVEEASMTWVDRLGFDLRVLTRSPQEIREVRIPFQRQVTDDRDARSAIIMMAQVAWERERRYTPPDIPLQSTQALS